ncbi:MAG: hypothetical protein U0610_25220 [bacterium]
MSCTLSRFRHAGLASAILLALLAGAPDAWCGETIFEDDFNQGGTCAWSSGAGNPSTIRSFCVRTPSITLAPGDLLLACYYFRTPNTETVGIRSWSSELEGGVLHALVYATRDTQQTPIERQPPGTVSTSVCGIADTSGNATYASWVYGAHDPLATLDLPADDGSGKPLAQELAPAQPLFVEMLLSNPSDVPIQAYVTLGATAVAPAVPYTRTDTYLTYSASINIPPDGVPHTVSAACNAPTGVQFWRLSTETHSHATEAKLKNGLTPLVVSTDWEHPSAQEYSAPGFYSFAGGSLGYSCTYVNVSGQPITTGNALTDEICVGIGHFFPATRPYLCFNSTGPL